MGWANNTVSSNSFYWNLSDRCGYWNGTRKPIGIHWFTSHATHSHYYGVTNVDSTMSLLKVATLLQSLLWIPMNVCIVSE